MFRGYLIGGFFLVAGLITPNSELLIRNVGINPTRSGIIDILLEMGGAIELLDERDVCGEPVADLLVKSSRLHGIEIGGAVVPRAIDEFPVVAVAAAVAEGVRRFATHTNSASRRRTASQRWRQP